MIGEEFILVYFRSDKEDGFNSIRNQYLHLIGGQAHVQCREHKYPFISSYEKKLRCLCEKKLPIHVVMTIVMIESIGIVLNNLMKTLSHSLNRIQ